MTEPAIQTEAPAAAESQALAEAPKFSALSPIGNASTLKGLLERNRDGIAALLPKHVTPDRIIKTMLVAVNRNPALLRCTQASVFETIQRAAELGLDLSGTLGEAYPVPFSNKISLKEKNGVTRDVWVDQCTLIPGYRGLAKLARQSGEISRLEADPVREQDHFIYQKGSDFKLEFRPKLDGERGEVRGYYAYVRFKDGGEQAEYMTVADVQRVRQSSKSKDSPAWKNHFDEMGRKTVFRRLAKWLPLSSEKFALAVETDNLDYDLDALAPAIEIEPGGSKTDALAQRLAQQTAGDGAAVDDDPLGDALDDPDEHPEARPRGTMDAAGIARVLKVAQAKGLGEEDVERIVGGKLAEAPASAETEILRSLERYKPATKK